MRKNVWSALGPTSRVKVKQGHPEQAAQGCVQAAFEDPRMETPQPLGNPCLFPITCTAQKLLLGFVPCCQARTTSTGLCAASSARFGAAWLLHRAVLPFQLCVSMAGRLCPYGALQPASTRIDLAIYKRAGSELYL